MKMKPKRTMSNKERALIEKIERFFSMKRDINTKRITAKEFGSDDSLWELHISFSDLSKIPFFVVSSISNESSLLRIYVKVKLVSVTFPAKAPLQYVLASDAAKHSIFFTPLPMSRDQKDIIGGFAIEALLQKKYITEKDLIDACFRLAYGYNSIVNGIELSGFAEKARDKQKEKSDNGNDHIHYS